MTPAEQAALTRETLALMKTAQAAPRPDLLEKAFTQNATATQGLQAYDLEAPSKKLYPVLTPLRNVIARVTGGFGSQANWKAVTGINVNSLSAGVSEGNRGGVIATNTAEYNAAYRSIGLEDYVTFEADLAAQGFEDIKALAVEQLLRALMIQEERIILGGNSDAVALGTPTAPTATNASTGGTIGAATYNVIVVALTLEGFLNSSLAGGVPATVARTNADGSSDSYGGGSSMKSSAGSTVTTGGTNTISATTPVVAGACGYAWFVGTSGAEKLEAITTINSVKLTALAGTGANASTITADKSKNALIHDGILYQIWKTGSNSYVKNLATGTAGTGTPLTGDGAGGVVEIDDALKAFWDNWRLSPDAIWVSSQEQGNIQKKVLAGASNAAQRFQFNADQRLVAGGVMVVSYLNKFGMGGAVEIPIRIHPYLPPGTVLFTTNQLPYPLANVPSILRVKCRRDYYQLEWPLRSRKYEYGVYSDQVLQNYFPPAFGVITNIANG